MPKILADPADLAACWDDIRTSGFFAEGKYGVKLADAVSKWSGHHTIPTSSCGSGLYAVARWLYQELGGGTKVAAVCSNTFFATGAMFAEAGFTLNLIDCELQTFSMCAESLASSRVKPDVVVLTHVGGQLAADYEEIARWCNERNIRLVEDAAHAFGVKHKDGLMAGSLGLAAVYSLYPTKSIPAGEGGIVTTRNPVLAQDVRRFCNYGKYKQDGQLRYTGTGFNLRMDEWTAAVAYLQFQKREEIITARIWAAKKLQDVLPSLFGKVEGRDSNWYKYPVRREEAEELGIKRFSGQVYASSDQLAAIFNGPGDSRVLPYNHLSNCKWVGDHHVCLPLEEGMYDDMNKDQVLAWLRGEA